MRARFFKKILLLVFSISLSPMFLSSVAAQTDAAWKAPKSAKKIKNPLAKIVNASEKGEALFKTNCVMCHGEKGKGDGVAAVALSPKPADLSSKRVVKETDGEMFWKIENGKGSMPPWKSALSKKQRWQIVNYVRTLQPKAKIKTKTKAK